jgi:hypothetical protein
MTPDVVAVRQNLSLIADGSRPVANLAHSSTATWGATVGNKTLVWRSGVGITSSGALVYAGRSTGRPQPGTRLQCGRFWATVCCYEPG